MTNWKEYKLGEICSKIGSGATPKGGGDTYLESGDYALIRSQNVHDFYFSYNGLAFISEDQAKKLNNVTLEENDILLNITGDSVARVCQIPKNLIPARVNQHVAIIRPNESIIRNDFLKYFLLNPVFKEYMLMLSSSGATRNAITKGMIENFPIFAPDISTQTAIAEILSSLDDKIELNNKINQQLENLAQTLFKQWFIDFEFPDENGNLYKSSGGEMVDSELGEIPKGFSVETLSEQTELIRGISYSKAELVSKEDGVPFVNLKCFALNGTFRQDGLKYYNGKYKDKHILQNNDILVAVTDLTQDRVIIGLPILWASDALALPSLDVCVVRSESAILKNYLYYEFKSFRYKSRIIEFANGSTVLHLSVKGLETYQFPTPPSSILSKWTNIIDPILNQINSNIKEMQELSILRDTLIPKLISGELEIKNVNI